MPCYWKGAQTDAGFRRTYGRPYASAYAANGYVAMVS